MKYFTLLVGLAFLCGCTTAPSGVKDDPSYSSDVQPLFNASCAACHSGSSPSGNYDLSSRAGALGPGSDTVANVVAGQPDSSLLYQRLEAGTMPPSGRWDSVKVHTVRNWIARGAKEN